MDEMHACRSKSKSEIFNILVSLSLVEFLLSWGLGGGIGHSVNSDVFSISIGSFSHRCTSIRHAILLTLRAFCLPYSCSDLHHVLSGHCV